MKTFLPALALTAILSGIILSTGCETESSTENNVRISPNTATLAKGESQEFTASGGYEYRWSLENGGIVDEWGTLSVADGPSTVYTSSKDSSTAGTFRIIRVTSTIPGSSGYTGTGSNATTTADSYAMTAEVHVEHNVKYSAMSISPAVTTLTNLQSASFTLSGGNPPYSWHVSPGGNGELTQSSETQATYTRTYAGSSALMIVITASSADGQAAEAQVNFRN
jgi:hypothetical protein